MVFAGKLSFARRGCHFSQRSPGGAAQTRGIESRWGGKPAGSPGLISPPLSLLPLMALEWRFSQRKSIRDQVSQKAGGPMGRVRIRSTGPCRHKLATAPCSASQIAAWPSLSAIRFVPFLEIPDRIETKELESAPRKMCPDSLRFSPAGPMPPPTTQTTPQNMIPTLWTAVRRAAIVGGVLAALQARGGRGHAISRSLTCINCITPNCGLRRK